MDEAGRRPGLPGFFVGQHCGGWHLQGWVSYERALVHTRLCRAWTTHSRRPDLGRRSRASAVSPIESGSDRELGTTRPDRIDRLLRQIRDR